MLALPAGSPALTCFETPFQAALSGTSGGSGTATTGSRDSAGSDRAAATPRWAAAAARLLLGPSPPLRLRIVPTSGSHGIGVVAAAKVGARPAAQEQQPPCLLPLVVGLGPAGAAGRGAPQPDSVRLALGPVPLWRGAMAGRSLILVTDPRCSHTIRCAGSRRAAGPHPAAWLLLGHARCRPSRCQASCHALAALRPCGLACPWGKILFHPPPVWPTTVVPSCCSVEWDVAAWLAVSLRHHVYALLPLCIALSMAAVLGNSSRSTHSAQPPWRARAAPALVPVAVAAAAWGSQHAQRARRATGLAPWVEVSVLEAAALLVVAFGALIVVRSAVWLGLQLGSRVAALAAQWAHHLSYGTKAAVAWSLAVVGAACVHPVLALFVGVARLWLCLAGWCTGDAAATVRPSGAGREGDPAPKCSGGKAGAAAAASPAAGLPDPGSALRRRLAQPAAANGLLGEQRAGQVQGESAGAGSCATREAPVAARCLTRGGEGVAWLTHYCLLALLAAPGFAAWAHSRHRAGLVGRLSMESSALTAMGLHACWLAQQVGVRAFEISSRGWLAACPKARATGLP